MANHDAVAALPVGSDVDKALLRDVLVARMPYVLTDSDSYSTLVETDPASGAVIQDILLGGRVFHLDPLDGTTAGDGVSCLVTAGGKRYKLAVGTDVVAFAVLSRANSDPASPALDDAYLVNPAATGAFNGADDNVAIFTARGWEFVDFGIGRLLYVENEDAYYRRKTDGSWAAGLGSVVIGAGTVPPSAFIGGGGHALWLVENQTTNTPPAVTNGIAYIIGSSPDGAWAGNAGKIAHGEAGAWVIYSPSAGWLAYDKTVGQNFQFSGVAWLSATGRLNKTLRKITASGNWSKPARLAYIMVTCIAPGGLAGVGTNGASGGSVSFGTGPHCSATGGQGGQGGTGTSATGGTGSGGDMNFTGQSGPGAAPGDGVYLPGGIGAGGYAPHGAGAGVFAVSGSIGAGAGGGCAVKVIDAAALASTEVVTISAAGANNGVIVVEEYTYA